MYIANSCKEIRKKKKKKHVKSHSHYFPNSPHFRWIFQGFDFGPFWVPKFTTSCKEISYFICLEKKKKPTPTRLILPIGWINLK
jgi:hypothetical protein